MHTINVAMYKIDYEYLDANFEIFKNKLYSQRRDKINQLKNKKAAITSLAAGLLLQRIVEDVCGIKQEDICVEIDEFGKPYIRMCNNFYFNISHSGDVVVIAYGKEKVGVDIEEIEQRKRDITVAKRCFSKKEFEYIILGKGEFDEGSSPTKVEDLDINDIQVTEDMYNRFFQVWTMKESYLKYVGTGINDAMSKFTVTPWNLGVIGENVSFYTKIVNNSYLSVCTGNKVCVEITHIDLKNKM